VWVGEWVCVLCPEDLLSEDRKICEKEKQQRYPNGTLLQQRYPNGTLLKKNSRGTPTGTLLQQRYPPRGTLLKNLSSSKSAIISLMTENTPTHQIGFTRTNCAWIALNLLLNIFMCHLFLQISPRPQRYKLIISSPIEPQLLASHYTSSQNPLLHVLPFELTVPPSRCTYVDSLLTQHIPTYIPHVCVYHTHVHTHIGGGFSPGVNAREDRL